MPKYVLPVGGGGKGGRRFSHYAPLVSKVSDNGSLGPTSAGDQDDENSSEEEGQLAARLFRTGSTRSRTGGGGGATGSVSSTGGTMVRHRITRGGSEVSEDDSVMSAPAAATAQ